MSVGPPADSGHHANVLHFCEFPHPDPGGISETLGESKRGRHSDDRARPQDVFGWMTVLPSRCPAEPDSLPIVRLFLESTEYSRPPTDLYRRVPRFPREAEWLGWHDIRYRSLCKSVFNPFRLPVGSRPAARLRPHEPKWAATENRRTGFRALFSRVLARVRVDLSCHG